MSKLIIGLALATMIFASIGCVAPPPSKPVPVIPPIADSSTSSAINPEVEARLVDRTWISPAMVQIANFYPGARAEWHIRVHNGNNIRTEFSVVYREPDYTKESYSKAPASAKDWVIIADQTPVLAPKETREVLVVLAMPLEAKIDSKKWEFWIAVAEKTGGQIATEMASRWLVQMR